MNVMVDKRAWIACVAVLSSYVSVIEHMEAYRPNLLITLLVAISNVMATRHARVQGHSDFLSCRVLSGSH